MLGDGLDPFERLLALLTAIRVGGHRLRFHVRRVVTQAREIDGHLRTKTIDD